MHHRIGTRCLVLARRRRARIDANARHAHRMRALDVVKAVANHHGIIRGRAQGRQGIADRIGLGLATLRRIHANHRLKLRKPELTHHVDALGLHARRRHGHTLALGDQPIQQLGDSIEHGVLFRSQLVKKGTVLVGHHKRLLARKAVKVVKALPQGRPNHAAQVTHLRLRKPARSQRLARRDHHRPARICHRAVKIEQHNRPSAYLQRLHRHPSSPVGDFHTYTSNC